MKRKNKLIALLLVALLLLPAFAAAGQAASRTARIVSGTGRDLTNKALTLYAGQTCLLKARFTPAIAGKATWRSSKPQVAKVSEGRITAVSRGIATITASFGGAKAKIRINVKRNIVDDINSKPSTSKVKKQEERVKLYLKSVEILSTGNVSAVYYVGNNSGTPLKYINNAYIEVAYTESEQEGPDSSDEFLVYGIFKRITVNAPAYGVSKIRLTYPKKNIAGKIPPLYRLKRRFYTVLDQNYQG